MGGHASRHCPSPNDRERYWRRDSPRAPVRLPRAPYALTSEPAARRSREAGELGGRSRLRRWRRFCTQPVSPDLQLNRSFRCLLGSGHFARHPGGSPQTSIACVASAGHILVLDLVATEFWFRRDALAIGWDTSPGICRLPLNPAMPCEFDVAWSGVFRMLIGRKLHTCRREDRPLETLAHQRG